jgi:ABC-type nitrate/sulfonate/bicarbonate transport system substrate-binding protein
MANYTYITASANIKPAAGKLKGIFVSAASSTPTITVYDSAAATTTTTLLGVFTPTAATSYILPLEGAYAKNGIYVVISGTVSATVLYE